MKLKVEHKVILELSQERKEYLEKYAKYILEKNSK